MDKDLDSIENMKSSSIEALASVKELKDEPKGNFMHTLILILMVIFAVFFVGLSVFNFSGLVKIKNTAVKLINYNNQYNNQVQKLTK